MTTIDALTGTDLTNLELLSTYPTLVVAPGDVLDPQVMRSYQQTGGTVEQATAR